MAKLCVHGEELLRVENTYEQTSLFDESVLQVVVTRTFHQDGKALEKTDFIREDGSRHGTGWKLRGKFNSKLTIAELCKRYVKQGWRIINGTDIRDGSCEQEDPQGRMADD